MAGDISYMAESVIFAVKRVTSTDDIHRNVLSSAFAVDTPL
ncbi:hypothetical protein [Rhizobium chutanense]|nr:hypothetical protein [Rhizobium chutanense]